MKKNNEIQKLFDNAIEGGIYTNIESEKIKNNVMERLGKQAGDNVKLSDSEETVEPVIVTSSHKKNRKPAVFFAAAAATCLGVTVIGTGFLGNGKGVTSLVGGNSEVGGDIIISTIPETEAAEITEKIEAAEITDKIETATNAAEVSKAVIEVTEEDVTKDSLENTEDYHFDSIEDFLGEKYPLKNTVFTLLDGAVMTITYGENGTISCSGRDANNNYILSEDNGRVFCWNGKEKKDITDLFSTDKPYIDSYENEESGLTHYIAVVGDAASGEYAYAEIFAVRERKWVFHVERNANDDPYDDPYSDEEDDEYFYKISKLIDEVIQQVSGSRYFTYSGGGGKADFKTVILPCDR